MSLIDEIKVLHRLTYPDITARLDEFHNLWERGTDQDIFAELAFCLFTPQSKARSCWAAVERLQQKNLLMSGNQQQIAGELIGVRFHRTKAARVVRAREQFFHNGKSLKSIISRFENPFEAREWLVMNVNGLGYKEASHFLRNIGMGHELAILDRHILGNLVSLEVIDSLLSSISRRTYLEIEKKMDEFAEEIDIPLDHLDMLLWYKEAGEIFK